MTRLVLKSPLAGWCLPAEEIPDAAFAQRMLGDGVALDPTGHTLHAPCDGEVISIAAARHAVALRHASGAEVLLHVGIDTVALAGDGFELRVRKGDRVRAGDALIGFDLALLARRAASLVTPVVVTNGERFRIVQASTGRELAVGDDLLVLEEIAGAAANAAPAGAVAVSAAVVVRHAHGIHARPAALIARHAKALPFVLELRARGRGVDPRSAVALMSLGVRGGDEVVITGASNEAAAAVHELVNVIRALDDAPAPAAKPAPRAGKNKGPVIASRGFALGAAFKLQHGEVSVAEQGAGVAVERDRLSQALAAVRAQLEARTRKAAATTREILEAHLTLLDDTELAAAAGHGVAAGKSAAYSWRTAVRDSAAALEATEDARLIERIDDLLDLERQVLAALGCGSAAPAIPRGAILIARDLKPSELIDLEPGAVAGIVLAAGGPTSHVAILAGVRGIPMLVAAGPDVLDVADGTPLILDAETPALRVNPPADALADARRALEQRGAREAAQLAAAQAPCKLASGERIEVFANLVGSEADARQALAQGAEGCGLLRTEFLFLDRGTAPDEAEQLECYARVARLLDGRPLVIRTLDAGGDKPIPYLPLPAEENPALGLRGIRTSLWRPELLETQLRALLRVRPAAGVRVLLPMITDVAELRTVREMLERVRADLGAPPVQVGVMIETPSAAVLADQLAREADFLSIGTNDLAQYTLAMDRGHAELAARIDAAHPAVLRLIGRVTEAAAPHGRHVAVCGGLASDPAAVPLLIGLGVTELSAVPAVIPQLKALISTLTLEGCRALARAALQLGSSQEVRALLAAKTLVKE